MKREEAVVGDYTFVNMQKILETSSVGRSNIEKFTELRNRYNKLVQVAERVWDSTASYLSKPFERCNVRKNLAAFIIMGEAWSRPEDSIPTKQSIIDRCHELRLKKKTPQDRIELEALESVVDGYDKYVSNLTNKRSLIIRAYKQWRRLRVELDSIEKEMRQVSALANLELGLMDDEQFKHAIKQYESNSAVKKGPVKLSPAELKQFRSSVAAILRDDSKVVLHSITKRTKQDLKKFWRLADDLMTLASGLRTGMDHEQFIGIGTRLINTSQAEHLHKPFIDRVWAERELKGKRNASLTAIRRFAAEELKASGKEGYIARIKDSLTFTIKGLSGADIEHRYPRKKFFQLGDYKFKVEGGRVGRKPVVRLIYVGRL
jgi:hypothetical protein